MTNKNDTIKLPSLDGWRAVSIALVLLCHSTFTPGFPAGWHRLLFNYSEDVGIWGVRFFFVISGFLITHLLLRERARAGFISLKKFYVRRALRILPVCFFYLFFLGFFTRYSQDTATWLANFTFTTNFLQILHPTPTGHLWSLGVEEQFYLAWPCLLVWMLNRPEGISKSLKLLLVPLLVAPVVRLMLYNHWYPGSLQFLFLGGSFLVHFDALAYGCLAAILCNHWRSALEAFYNQYAGWISAGGTLLVFAPWLLPFHGRLRAAGFDSLQAIGFSLLLVQSILHPRRGCYRCLNWKWVVHLGVLSYSIYIWQQMFCGTSQSVFGINDAWWLGFPMWILVALLAAHASYYLLEKPMLTLRARFHNV